MSTNDLQCPQCGNKRNDLIAGVERTGIYDGVLYWSCVPCGHRWHRFPERHYLRARAEPYVGGVATGPEHL